MGIRYEIRVRGAPDPSWSAWFEGFIITYDNAGTTVITGEVMDEAAFYGLIGRARDLGLTVLSVERRDSGADSLGAAHLGTSGEL